MEKFANASKQIVRGKEGNDDFGNQIKQLTKKRKLDDSNLEKEESSKIGDTSKIKKFFCEDLRMEKFTSIFNFFCCSQCYGFND